MQNLETCLLIAEADRVLCHLIMFLTVFLPWIYEIKYSCCQNVFVILGWCRLTKVVGNPASKISFSQHLALLDA